MRSVVGKQWTCENLEDCGTCGCAIAYHAQTIFSIPPGYTFTTTKTFSRLTPLKSLSKMDDVFDGAIGIDLGTTYSYVVFFFEALARF